MLKYEFLAEEIYKRHFLKKDIAAHLNISTKALNNKIKGIAPFTWEQACEIQIEYFPDLPKETLFSIKGG